MTKEQELEVFSAFADSFPQDTYLRPWLDSIRADVERELRCDMFPSHTPTSWAAAVRKQAQEDAQRITSEAHREAAAILEQARMQEDEVARKRLRLYMDLKAAMSGLY